MTLTSEGVPVTAADALALWDSGEAVPAIRLEGARQIEMYAVAFEVIRQNPAGLPKGTLETIRSVETIAAASHNLSDREFDSALSVAHVALEKGWAAMLAQHDHPSIPKMTVQRPKLSGE